MENSEQEASTSHPPKQRRAFELIEKNFAIVGITPSLVHQPYPLNGAILFGFFLLGLDILCVLLFVLNDAESFAEYTQCAYIISIMTSLILVLLSLIVTVKELFEFIDDGNDLFNTSKFNTVESNEFCWDTFTHVHVANISGLKYSSSESIFRETIQLECKLCENMFFALKKAKPVAIFLPFVIYSYFAYFTTDLGANAFQLTYSMW